MWCQRLAGLISAFASHTVFGAGQITDATVTGAVSKQRCGKSQLLTVSNVFGDDGRNLIALLFDLECVHIQKQMYVFLSSDDSELFLVVVVCDRLGISPLSRVEFFDDISESWIRRKVNLASEMDADVRAVISAKNGAVLYQCYL